MEIKMIPLTAILLIIVIGVTIFILIYLLEKKYDKFLLENSFCLMQLKEINSRYNFYPDICFDQFHTYDNEKMYDSISCADYLIYQLQYNRIKVIHQINNINLNNRLYSQYLDEVKSVSQFGKYKVSQGKLNLDELIKREKILIEKLTYRAPCLQFKLKVTLYCSTINGRVYMKKSEIFEADAIITFVRKLSNKSGDFYNDREIWDAITRVERGKVSNKMRFSIYARDGYRCRNCGISDRYAQLEIDHIIPISKGGKSTYDNLQTLCHKCNVEKGNRL